MKEMTETVQIITGVDGFALGVCILPNNKAVLEMREAMEPERPLPVHRYFFDWILAGESDATGYSLLIHGFKQYLAAIDSPEGQFVVNDVKCHRLTARDLHNPEFRPCNIRIESQQPATNASARVIQIQYDQTKKWGTLMCDLKGFPDVNTAYLLTDEAILGAGSPEKIEAELRKHHLTSYFHKDYFAPDGA